MLYRTKFTAWPDIQTLVSGRNLTRADGKIAALQEVAQGSDIHAMLSQAIRFQKDTNFAPVYTLQFDA